MNQTGIVTLFSPGFNLNLLLFPSHREGLGMGGKMGWGYGGRGSSNRSPMGSS